MNERLKRIINEWNPMEIYPLLDDEYNYEVKRIQDELQNHDLDADELGNVILQVFSDSFGERFPMLIEDCISIAKKYFDVNI